MTAETSNYSLREDIRAYWSERAETFDLSFGHKIQPGLEFDAWAQAVRRVAGPEPRDVLELASGTGEVTGVLLALGHRVTGLDFAEPMLARARAKHQGNARARFRLADAEDTMEPDGAYDLVISRHLVWTLLDPQRAFHDWFRVLRPGGAVLIFDGNWNRTSALGRLVQPLIGAIDRLRPRPRHVTDAMIARHRQISAGLPLTEGVSREALAPLLERAGFEPAVSHSPRPILAAQRRIGSLREALGTLVHEQVILEARKPPA